MADYTADPDFMAASPQEKHQYLMTADPGYAKAPADEQKAYLSSFGGAPAAPAPPPETAFGKITRIAGEEAAKTPGRVVESIKNLVSGGAEALQNPKMSTTLPMTMGPAAGIVTRLGTLGAGAMVDQPSESPIENLKTGFKGITGYDLNKPFDWRQALSTVTSPAAMEAILPAAGPAFRATGPGRRAVNRVDAANVGQTMEDIAPPLAGARTAEDIRAMAAGPGQKSLGSAKGDVVNTIQARVGDITVPSLGSQPMPLQAANDRLTEIGKLAFSRNPVDRTFQGIDQRRLWGQVSTDIENSLAAQSPAAAQAWREAQEGYASGLAMMRVAQKPSAYRQTSGGPELNMPYLQKLVQQPKMEAALRNKLGDSAYDQLVDTLTRGAGTGADEMRRTLLVRTALSPMIGAGGFFLGGPAGAAAGAALPFAFPNVASKYVGRLPYSVGPIQQTLADVAASGAQR